MSKFLVTYHGGGMPSDPEQAQQAVAAFGAWLGRAGKAVLDPGAPLRIATKVGSGSTDDPIGGYSVIEADSVDGAVSILESHPFVSRGGTLAVHQAIDI
jgi:hypothetical protein